MNRLKPFKLFDSHFHIIDQAFPLVTNQGYLPDDFNVRDYLKRTQEYDIAGGAVVSGSFQAFDQTYLLAALKELGPNFVGVTQLPASVSDDELLRLDNSGVRAVRFNLKRGGSEEIDQLESFARRIYDLIGWHVELYVDSTALAELAPLLTRLPRVSVDHLGLSKAGFNDLLSLVEQGVYVKATGFGRVDFAVTDALQQIIQINPDALLFGTDLPSTRAPRPYADEDFDLVVDALGEEIARKVFYDNAMNFYRPGRLLPQL